MIPIFRAKKIDSDEYVEGCLLEFDSEYFIVKDTEGCYLASDCFHYLHYNEIDPTTLSIHFPDMLDSEGNKIFASLQKDGRSGDICSVNDYIDSGLNGVAIYQNYGFRIDRKGKAMGICLSSTDIKIIGIQ